MSAKIKMWLKIIAAALTAVFIAVTWLFFIKRRSAIVLGSNDFKEKLEKAKTEAAIEIGIARGKEEAVKEEIEVIRAIDDRAERLRRISDLMNRTSRTTK